MKKYLSGAAISHCRTCCSLLLFVFFGLIEFCNPPVGHSQDALASTLTTHDKLQLEKLANPQGGASLTVAAVGDIIAARSFADVKDANFRSVMSVIAKSDVGFANLEGTLLDAKTFKGWPEAENGGMWLIGVPQIAADLRLVGFRLLARANNHSTEWGRDGMRETDTALDQAGIVHAGTGENRAFARAASFLTTPKGTVSLVSMASSFTPSSTASPTQPNVVSRPGMNAIRTEEFHIVSPEMMETLLRISESQQERSLSVPTKTGAEKPTELTLFDVSYRVGLNVGGSSFKMNPSDLAESLASIREGKRRSNFLVATIHTHEPGNWSQQPPDFLIDLAHQSIDAGADEFIGHGPHQLRGIEVYKGKPIFYSLGDFIFEVEKQTPVPFEMYESLKQNPERVSDTELNQLFVSKYLNSEIWYQGVVAVTRFDDGRLSEIHLLPVELGFASQDGLRGLPRFPPPAIAQAILKRLQEISEPFHTAISIENNEGVIRLSGK
jgi:poly-gamma-glutamate capsule biosynthesis protein CapA/YwtB (metallophosphatase superfamily)